MLRRWMELNRKAVRTNGSKHMKGKRFSSLVEELIAGGYIVILS